MFGACCLRKKNALLLDAFQLLFVGTSTCVESKLSLLIAFYNLYILINKTVIVFGINVSSRRILVILIALIE